jgi:hypothetical protein
MTAMAKNFYPLTGVNQSSEPKQRLKAGVRNRGRTGWTKTRTRRDRTPEQWEIPVLTSSFRSS